MKIEAIKEVLDEKWPHSSLFSLNRRGSSLDPCGTPQVMLTGFPILVCVCTGVGALYVRRRPRVRMEPLQNGGGQERGLRSGTVPTPLAVGLGAACSIAQQEMEVKTNAPKHTETQQM